VFLGSKYGLSQGFENYDESLVKPRRKSHQQISSPQVTRKASAFLKDQADSKSGRPWFLWVHYFDPHKNYKRHEGSTNQFGYEDVDLYDGEIAFTDSYIGSLLKKLENLGLADQTVVAFVADHGEGFGDHGGKEHGRSLYREVEQIPLAIRVPGLPPRRVSRTVSGVDFMPTVLDLLGVDAPENTMMGQSFAKLLKGGQQDNRGALLESRLEVRSDVNFEAYVSERWKLIVEIPKELNWSGGGPRPEGSKTMLFQRKNDPTEQRDVSQENPEVVERMIARLDASLRAAREAAALYEHVPEQELSEEEIEQLRDLGYVGEE
jgi:arylsulfatase A-like enzyme